MTETRTVADLETGTDVWRGRTFDGSGTAVHLDPNCKRIRGTTPDKPKDPGVLNQSRRVCSFCDPTTPDPRDGGGSRLLNRALQREDVTDTTDVGAAIEAERDEEAGA